MRAKSLEKCPGLCEIKIFFLTNQKINKKIIKKYYYGCEIIIDLSKQKNKLQF